MSTKSKKNWVDDGLDAFAASFTATDSSNWISGIQDAIRGANLEIDKVYNSYSNNSIGSLGGFYAEAFHPGSFNINAAKAGSKHYTFREGSTANGSVDIGTSWKEEYGSKYHKTPQQSLARQAEIGNKPDISKYEGQERLIPSDQLKDAQSIASKKIEKELQRGNFDASERYRETKNHLTDRIESPDGVKSNTLKKSEADAWAERAKEGDVKHFEISNEVRIHEHLSHIGKAAGGAAAISVALQVAPVLVNGISKLITNPEYSAKSLGLEVGAWAKDNSLQIAVDSFTKASLAGSLATAQQLGKLSGPLSQASPALLSGIAVVAVETTKAIWCWGKGNCTGEQALSTSFVCGVKTTASLQGAAVGQVLIPIPVVGAVVGSLVGAFLAEKGLNSMANTPLMVILQGLDTTFSNHQKYLDLLTTTNEGYRSVSKQYDLHLANGTYLLFSAEEQEESNQKIIDELDETSDIADKSIEAARRRLDLWKGGDK